MNINFFKLTSSFLVLILNFTCSWAAPASDFERSEVKSFQNVKAEDRNMVLTFKLSEVKNSEDFPYIVKMFVNGEECTQTVTDMTCKFPVKGDTKTGKAQSVNWSVTISTNSEESFVRNTTSVMTFSNGSGSYANTAYFDGTGIATVQGFVTPTQMESATPASLTVTVITMRAGMKIAIGSNRWDLN